MHPYGPALEAPALHPQHRGHCANRNFSPPAPGPPEADLPILVLQSPQVRRRDAAPGAAELHDPALHVRQARHHGVEILVRSRALRVPRAPAAAPGVHGAAVRRDGVRHPKRREPLRARRARRRDFGHRDAVRAVPHLLYVPVAHFSGARFSVPEPQGRSAHVLFGQGCAHGRQVAR